MYFGEQYLTEGNTIKSSASNMINMISHMIKFKDGFQQQFQSSSWVNTIVDNNDQFIANHIAAGRGQTNFVRNVKKEFEKRAVKEINDILSENNTRIKITEVPAEYTYEFFLNKNNVVNFLITYVCTESALKQMEDKGITNIPDEVRRRCDRH